MGKKASYKWKKKMVVGIGLIIMLALSSIFLFNLIKHSDKTTSSRTAVNNSTGISHSKIGDSMARARKRGHRKAYRYPKGTEGGSDSPSSPNKIYVLMYHFINDNTHFTNPIDRSLTIPPGVLASQLDWLGAHGYHVVSLDDAYAAMTSGKLLPSKPVILTFDDGAIDSYTNVYPMLKQRGLSGTFFVIVDYVNGGGGLNWDKAAEMANAGMQIESHTMSHADLPKKSPEQMTYELQKSRATIEERLGRPANFIAYPFGGVNGTVAEATKEAGYKAAFTINPGPWRPGDDLFTIKRVRVSYGESMATFAAQLGYNSAKKTHAKTRKLRIARRR